MNTTRTLGWCGGVMLTLTGASQSFDWVRQAGHNSSEQARAVSSDAFGNAYVTGEMSPGTTFEDTTLYGTFVDGFVAKYAANGDLLWVRAIVGPDTESPYDISTDPAGNSYVVGLFNMTADFGDTTLTSAGSFDMFLAKYDTDGNLLWARRGGGNSGDAAEGVCVDGTGKVHVVGSFSLSASFGGQTLVSVGQMDVFWVSYSANGDVIDAMRGGGTGADYATDVDALGGHVAITGDFQGTADLGSGTLTSNGQNEAFLACYTLTGMPLWSASGGSDLPTGTEAGAGVAIGYDGLVYMSGSAGGNATFGPLSFTANGGGQYMDAFVVAYDTNGTGAWINHGGGNTVDGANAIAAAPGGGVYVTGHYNGLATFSGEVLQPFSIDPDIFTSHYSTTGTLQWIKAAGGPYGEDAGSGICLATDGLFVAGLMNRTATFDGITLPVLYLERNIFLAHMALDNATPVTDGAISLKPFRLVPNPAIDEVRLEVDPSWTGRVMVRVADMAGHELLVRSVDLGGSAWLSIADLAPGMYLCTVSKDGAALSGRLQVVR